MRIKDIMTHNVVTITSTTPVIEAERILSAHGFERLPVVDMGSAPVFGFARKIMCSVRAENYFTSFHKSKGTSNSSMANRLVELIVC